MNTQKFDEQDFRTSAAETVNDFFKGFAYPSREDFNDSQISHITDIVASIYMTQHVYRIGGGFVQSILEDKLGAAFSRADSTIVKAIRIMVYARDYGQVKKFKPHFETI